MSRFEIEREDLRDDERNESLKDVREMSNDELREEYNLKIEFYGSKDNSRDFDERIESLATQMREEKIGPDFESITREMEERSVPFLDERIQTAGESSKLFSEGITMKEYFSKCIETTNVKMISNEKELNLYDSLRELGVKKTFFDDKYIIDKKEVSPDDKINDYLPKDAKFVPMTREEIIDKEKNPYSALEIVLTEKYSKTDDVKIERDKNESLIDSLKKIYDEKGLNDPNLKYGLDNYEQCDRGAQTYVNAFAKSLSPEEKLCLIPRNADELRETIKYDLNMRDDLYRPIYGYCFLNNEMMDKLSESLQGGNCVEFGCGNGMLSRMLQDRGVNITPVDINNERDNHYLSLKNNTPATEITYMDAREYLNTTDEKIDYVILSWPPYNDPMAADICELLKEKSPDTQIVYIGEPIYGCTADDRFFELTERSDDQKGIDNANDAHYSFPNIYDSIELRSIKK